MTNVEADRFKKYKIIYLRNSVCEEKLTALPIMFIEKKNMVSVLNFNGKVIKIFAAKTNRHIELNVKTIK